MADLSKVNTSIEAAVQALLDLKKTLSSELEEKPEPVVQAQAVSEEPVGDLETFEQLKKALNSEAWPEAVNPNLICDMNSEKDKVERARGIIELMIEEDLNGLKFLDYGCGEGYCVSMATGYKTKASLGYDLKASPEWKQGNSFTLTTDFNVIKANAPYDIILLFDVLDHLKDETPVSVLRKLKDLLADKGKIYMRVHPYISRHGTHLYHSLNKAYAHLVFTESELKELLVTEPEHQEESIGVLYPIRSYGEFVDQSGLKVVNRRDLTERVEPFFKIPRIAQRIMQNTQFGDFPEFQMSLQFIDYILEKA